MLLEIFMHEVIMLLSLKQLCRFHCCSLNSVYHNPIDFWDIPRGIACLPRAPSSESNLGYDL